LPRGHKKPPAKGKPGVKEALTRIKAPAQGGEAGDDKGVVCYMRFPRIMKVQKILSGYNPSIELNAGKPS
jgi:hypothetical protein